MEGKYRPQQVDQKEYSYLGGNVSLMLRMCKPIFETGKSVVLYIFLCGQRYYKSISHRCLYRVYNQEVLLMAEIIL